MQTTFLHWWSLWRPDKKSAQNIDGPLKGQMNLLQCKKVVLKLTLEHNGKFQKCLGVLGRFLEENEWLKWFEQFFIQTGVPPEDNALCDFQAWLLSYMGMLGLKACTLSFEVLASLWTSIGVGFYWKVWYLPMSLV